MLYWEPKHEKKNVDLFPLREVIFQMTISGKSALYPLIIVLAQQAAINKRYFPILGVPVTYMINVMQ
ncbi:hypothetical protein D3C72_1436640 [compost metagenome]